MLRPSLLGDDTLWLFRKLPNASKRTAFFLLFLSALTSLFEVLTIGLMYPIILSLTDPNLLKNKLNSFFLTRNSAAQDFLTNPIWILLAFVCVVIACNISRIMLIRQTYRFATQAGSEISIRAFEKILHQPYAYHLSLSTNETISLVTHKVSTVINQVLISTINLISSFLICSVVIAFLCYVNLLVSMILISVLLCTYGLIAITSKSALRFLGEENANNQTQTIATVQESMGHIREMYLMGLQSYFLKRFARFTQRYRKAQSDSAAITVAKRPLIEMVVFLMMAGFIFLFLQSDAPQHLVLAILSVYALAAQRLLPAIHQIYTSWAGLINGQAALSHIVNTLSLTSPKQHTVAPLRIDRSVKLNNFSFKYPNATQFTFENQSIEIFKGERIGITGPSGAGKTTLIDLIAGLLVPQIGSIQIDGSNLQSDSFCHWHRSVGYVSQYVYVSKQSVAENIAIGLERHEIDMEKIISACHLAGLSAWIKTLDTQYETICGENGIRLSGGQRQKIGIARAIYANKPVLILDEPTSALDLQSESEIIETIFALDQKMTIIVVTHRASLLKSFDRILNVDQGLITEIRY